VITKLWDVSAKQVVGGYMRSAGATGISIRAHRGRKVAGVGVRFASADFEGGGDDPLQKLVRPVLHRADERITQEMGWYLGNIKYGVQALEISFQLFNKLRSKICVRQVAADNGTSHQTLRDLGGASEGVGTSTAESNGKNFGQCKIVEKLLNIIDKVKIIALGPVRAETIPRAVDADEKHAMNQRSLRVEVALKTAAQQPMKIPVR
jgi:hypothetical protein